MHGTLRCFWIARLLPFVLFSPIPADATVGPNMSAAEIALLPEWCNGCEQTEVTEHLTQGPEARAKLNAFQMSGCDSLHHYCWGLAQANRGYFWSPSSGSPADFFFGQAIVEFDYVIHHSRNTCALIPDMHNQVGELNSILGHPKEAEERFRKAISIKPNYAPAYVGLSDLFEGQGLTEKAVAVLQQGIKINPGSTALKKKLLRVQSRIPGENSPPGTSR